MPERSGSDWLNAVRDLPYLYLTTTGRKTGLPREIEIWFIVYHGSFYIFAENFDRADWVRNIMRAPSVRVRAGDRSLDATAATLNRTRDAAEWETVQDLARAKSGWGDGLPVRITPVQDEVCAANPCEPVHSIIVTAVIASISAFRQDQARR